MCELEESEAGGHWEAGTTVPQDSGEGGRSAWAGLAWGQDSKRGRVRPYAEAQEGTACLQSRQREWEMGDHIEAGILDRGEKGLRLEHPSVETWDMCTPVITVVSLKSPRASRVWTRGSQDSRWRRTGLVLTEYVPF